MNVNESLHQCVSEYCCEYLDATVAACKLFSSTFQLWTSEGERKVVDYFQGNFMRNFRAKFWYLESFVNAAENG